MKFVACLLIGLFVFLTVEFREFIQDLPQLIMGLGPNKTAVWVQSGGECVDCFPVLAVARCCCAASRESITAHVTNLDKIQNSEDGFYRMPITLALS